MRLKALRKVFRRLVATVRSTSAPPLRFGVVVAAVVFPCSADATAAFSLAMSLERELSLLSLRGIGTGASWRGTLDTVVAICYVMSRDFCYQVSDEVVITSNGMFLRQSVPVMCDLDPDLDPVPVTVTATVAVLPFITGTITVAIFTFLKVAVPNQTENM